MVVCRNKAKLRTTPDRSGQQVTLHHLSADDWIEAVASLLSRVAGKQPLQITSLAARRLSLSASILSDAILHAAERGSRVLSRSSSAMTGSGAACASFAVRRRED
jgi:hypothetical protein